MAEIKWKNHTEVNSEELVSWLKHHDITKESVASIIQDLVGNWHAFYIEA